MSFEQLLDDDPRKRLWDELVLLRNASDEFHYLFAGPRERSELLDRTAPWFFNYVSRLMVWQLILRISRLTDQPSVRGHRNLTISVLLDDPGLDSIPGLRARVTSAIADIHEIAKPVREHRHKAVAHLDHGVALQTPGAELPKLPKSLIEECLTEMERVYNLVSGEVHNTGAVFELSALGDAKSLVTALENAREWRSEHLRRMRQDHGLPPVGDDD